MLFVNTGLSSILESYHQKENIGTRVMNTGSRILFIAPPLAGHTFQLIVLAAELANRGYVTAFATEERFRHAIVSRGVEFVSWESRLSLTDKSLSQRYDTLWENVSREPHLLKGERLMWTLAADMYVPMYQTLAPVIRDYRPDLIVLDSGAFPAMDLADQNQIPYVILSQFLGPHAPIPAKFPRYGTSFSSPLSFRDRVMNFLHPLRALWYLAPCITRLNRARATCSAHTHWRDLYYKHLILVSTTFGIEHPRPLPPLIQMVGPLVFPRLDPLPDELKDWLERQATKTVYISCGTLATLEPWQAGALIEGTLESGARVLMALRKDQQTILPPLPDTVRIESFAPQQAILAHPAIAAFISHCGMNSLSESLYHGKPILGLPFFGDQHYNAGRVLELNVGLKLDKNHFTRRDVSAGIRTILNTPAFTENARRMSHVLVKAQGANHAANLVEMVLLAGIGHLQSGT